MDSLFSDTPPLVRRQSDPIAQRAQPAGGAVSRRGWREAIDNISAMLTFGAPIPDDSLVDAERLMLAGLGSPLFSYKER